MFRNKSKILIALFFLAFLPLATITFRPSIMAQNPVMTRLVPTPGTDSYSEDFTTTTYQNAGATNAQGWGNGTITNPRTYSIQLLDYYNTPDPVMDVDVQGRKAYTVLYDPLSSSQTIRILNITNPSDITLLGYRDSSVLLNTTIVDGDTLYVGSSWKTQSWLGVYNVSNPYNIPGPIANIYFSTGNITDFDIQGHFLYIVLHNGASNDFTIVDVEDPDNINLIYDINFSDLYGVDVEGQLAYLADGTIGLYIRNVSNPYSTTHVGNIDTPGTCTDVLVDGHLAYIADGSSGVQIIDVSTPSSPSIIGSYDTSGDARRLALQGDTLYVADGSNGLVILDVADPTHPIYVDRINLPYTWDVDLYGADVVVATNGGVYTLRIGYNLAALPLMGTYDTFDAWDVRVQGDIAYVAGGSDGFLTIDVSDPGNPILLDRYTGATFYQKLDVQGHLAFVTEAATGDVRIFDVSDPSNIQYIGYYGLTYSQDVFVDGDVIYVADGPYGVYIGNISDPYNPSTITFVDPGTENITAVWVQGYHLYVGAEASMGESFLIYNIQDISSPQLVYSWDLTTACHYDVFVDGDSSYVAELGGNVALWNVTDPYNAYYSDFINYASSPMGVWGFGPYLLAGLYGAPGGGVALINATNINDLDIITTNTGVDGATQVTVHGDYAYVANRSSLVILRLFRSAGSTYIPGACQAMSVEVDTTARLIENATLTYNAYIPPGTSITFEMSADGGTHWETVTPSVEHNFANSGNDLRWRATLNTPLDDRSVHLYSVNINYEYNDLPTAPTLTDPGDTDDDGAFTVSWSASTDDGSVASYLLQMSDSNTFTSILDSWTPTTTSQDISGLTDGTYYFRVRAVDDDGETGPWSSVENIVVAFPTPPIPGFPAAAVAIGLLSALGLGVISRRRQRKS